VPYAAELEVARAAAAEAARIIRRHYDHGTEVWEKAKDDPVTAADLEADHTITKQLRSSFPADPILSEESVPDPERLGQERVWIVDPMDGTREFTRRIPEFAVSIALCERGEPVVGVVHNPVKDVSVWAARGSGCWRNGASVRVSSCERLEDAVLIASRSETSRDELVPYQGWFSAVRPVGSIAWKLACIASGDGDLNVSLAPKNEWDVCAGDLLVREAGGVYQGADQQPRRYNQPDSEVRAGMAAGRAELVRSFFERQRREGI
jgi:myo-inositol-1(or 4)-monophosphatase